MDFDPQKYLAEKLGQQPMEQPQTPSSAPQAPSFDPQAYLAQRTQSPSNLGNDLSDLGQGLLNGATLGGGAVVQGGLNAGLQAANSYLSGSDGKSFLELYNNAKNQALQNQNTAKTRSPWLYGGGELAGGLVPGAALGPLGGGTTLAESMAAGGTTGLLNEIGERAITGGLVGGLSGALSSNGSLGSNEQLQDIAAGTEAGGLTAPLLSGAIEGIGTTAGNIGTQLSNMAEDNPGLKRFMQAYQKGFEGEGFKGVQQEQASTDRINNAAQDMSQALSTARRQLSANLGATLESGDNIDPSNFVDSSQGMLDSLPEASQDVNLADTRDYQRLQALLNVFKKNITPDIEEGGQQMSDVSPQEFYNFRKNLTQLQGNTSEPAVRSTISDMINMVDNHLNEIPGYSESLNNLKTIPAQTAELFTNKPLNEYGSQAEGEQALTDSLASTIRKIGGYGARDSDIQARNTVETLRRNLQNLEEKQPELFQALGLNNLENKIKSAQDVSDLEEIRQIIMRKLPHGSVLGQVFETMFLPLKYVTGFDPSANYAAGLNIANKVGQVAGHAGKASNYISSNIGALSRNLYNGSPEFLQGVAQTLSNNGMGDLGKTLSDAVTNKNAAMQNAATFSIMQNPAARGLLHLDNTSKIVQDQ